ncbi:hypothetical protein D3C87_1941560 [compost metagenome]
MHGVRGGDVDDVHFRVVGQRLVGGVAAGHAEFGAESVGAFLGARCYRYQCGAGRIAQAFRHCLGDFARAQNAPADYLFHRLFRFLPHGRRYGFRFGRKTATSL